MQRPLCRGMGFFSLLWFGSIISVVGSGMTGFAIGTTLYQDTRSVTLYALIGLATAVPTLLLSPLAGSLADRFDRRLILILSALGSSIGTLALYWLVSSGRLASVHLYLIVAFRAAAAAFVWPTFAAATTLIVGKENFGRASGMLQMGASFSLILAPLLGGLAVGPLGVDGVILIDVATFFVAIMTRLVVRFPQPERKRTTPGESPGTSEEAGALRGGAGAAPVDDGGFAVAWRFVRERPGLLWLLLLFAALNFCTGIVQISLTPMVLSFTTRPVLGMVLSLASAGSLVGGILMSVWGGPPPGRRVGAILTITFTAGFLLMIGGLSPSAALISSAAFCFMLGFPILAGSSQAIWQSKVPPEMQGRVFAVRRMVAGSAIPAAFAAAGPLADYLFEPLLAVDGPLAGNVGRLIGVGPGRGIAFSMIIFGFLNVLITLLGSRSRKLRSLEEDVPDAVEDTPREGGPAPARPRSGTWLGRLGTGPAAALLAVLALASAAALRLERPPAAPDDPALAELSAERMMDDVRAIAREPHPTGTRALAEVRDHLVARLREIGLETEVQEARDTRSFGRVVRAVTVHNVVARLPGREPGRAVALAAHYDSVPTSPGASDNGAAVAVLLETARLLAAGPPLRNDVIFVFPDAEEVALNGARAFVQQHPRAREVAVVLNFDARGHTGPAYMFQTGEDNGWWIREFAGAVAEPRTSSLLGQIYRKLPNDTDFTPFLEAGYAGFNHAFIEGLTHYHSMLDTPQDLDERSLLHQGSYALSLARHFAELDLSDPPEEPDRAYFNVLGSHLVHYPRGLAAVSAALVGALFLMVFAAGLRWRQLSVGGLAQGFLAFLGLLIALPVAATLMSFVAREVAGATLIQGSTPGGGIYLTAFAFLASAGFLALYGFLRRIAAPLDLAAGALIWWLVLTILTSGPALPVDTNFPFVWPLGASLLGLSYLLLASRRNRRGGGDGEDSGGDEDRGVAVDPRRWSVTAVLAVTALPGILLFMPLTIAVGVGLQAFAAAPVVLQILLLGLLIPHFEVILARRGRWLTALAAGAGAVLLGWAIVHSLGSASRLNSVLYAQDADTGEQHWFSLDLEIDDWTRQFGFEPGARGPFDHFLPAVRREVLRSPAPAVDLPRAELEVLGVRELAADLRELDLRVRLPGGSQVRATWFEPHEAVVAFQLDGSRLSLARAAETAGPTVFQQVPARPEELLTVRLRGAEPVKVHMVDQLEGLPELAGIPPRPEGMLPRPIAWTVRSDVTLIRRSFDLPRPSEGPAADPAPAGL